MPYDEEWRRKISESLRAKGTKSTEHLRTPEIRALVSGALKGRTIPSEVRQKQSETRKRLFAEGKLAPWNKGDHRPRPERRGAAAGKSWKGGRHTDKNGYIWVNAKDHPMSSMVTKRGYVLEHRLVMAEFLGRVLHPWESVHHRNAIRSDNRIQNLQLVLTGRHQGRVKCPHCRKEFAIR